MDEEWTRVDGGWIGHGWEWMKNGQGVDRAWMGMDGGWTEHR